MPNIRFLLFRIFVALAGVPVKRAKNLQELSEVMRLRFQVYHEEGYISEKDFPDGKLTDEYDENSVQLFLRGPDGKIIGSGRVVLPNTVGFPIQAFFPSLHFYNYGGTAGELGRFVVVNTFRGGMRRYSASLLYGAWRESKRCGLRYWYIVTPDRLARTLRLLGFRLKLLDPGMFPKASDIGVQNPHAGYFSRFNPKPFLCTLP